MYGKKIDNSIKLFIVLMLLTAVDSIVMADATYGRPQSSDDVDGEPFDFAITSDTGDEEILINDFDENLTSTEGSTPTGSTYRLDVHYSGARGWCDAEKAFWDLDDDLMCWAATASNVLYWTGWGVVGGMTNTDQMFDYFQDHWTDKGGSCYYGWNWWFDGTETVPGSGWSSVHDPGGNFWSTTDFYNYVDWSQDEPNILEDIDDFLRDGYGIGLSIAYYDGSGDRHGHAITCWGVNFDSSNTNYYVGIWVTDSDDSKNYDVIRPWLGSHELPNKLQYYGVYKSGNKWYMSDYGSHTWQIEGAYALGAGPGIPPKVNAGADKTGVNEGSRVYFGGSFTNPGPSSGYSYEWNFGDGTKVTGTLSPSHVFRDNGVYTVTLKVTDQHGDTGSDTLKVTVGNVAPTANAGLDITTDEGATTSFSGGISDPGTLDTHTVAWDFGDGSPIVTGTLTPSHIYRENGVYTVTLTVTDDDGGSDTDTLLVTVNNVAPVVDVVTGFEITFEDLYHRQNVGSHYPGVTFSTGAECWKAPDYNYVQYPAHSGSCIIADIYTGEIRIDFDTPVSMVGAWFVTDSTTVYLYAYDSLGNLLDYTSVFSGYYNNKFAKVQASGIAYVIFHDTAAYWGLDDLIFIYENAEFNEGDTVGFIGSYTDPGIYDTHTFDWDFGDGSTHVSGTLTPSYIYGDNGVYTVTLTVTDDDGGVGTGTIDVTILNVAPTVEAGADQVADEGNIVSFSGSYFDPGFLDTHTFDWDFGDGNIATGTLTPYHIYGDNGIYTVTLTVTDDDGGVGTDTLEVTVNNVAPTVEAGVDLEVDEGAELVFAGSFFDPGFLDTHTFNWDFGDGNFADGSLTPSHAYADNGVYTVTLTVTDDDGGVGVDTLTVTVYNVAPTASIDDVYQEQWFTLEENIIIMLDPANFTGSSYDPGADDLTFTWIWGDGTPNTVTFYPNSALLSPTGAVPPGGSLVFPVEITETVTHVYTEPGEYVVTLIVEDDDGGSSIATLAITVWGPQGLKRAVIAQLESVLTNEKCVDRHFKHIIKMIEYSLCDKFWINETHLNPKFGVCAFNLEHCAVKQLEIGMKMCGWCIFKLEKMIKCFTKRGWDTTWIEEKIAALHDAIDFLRSAILKVVKADELIVRVALEDAMNVDVDCEKFQRMYEKYILKALCKIAKAAKAFSYGCYSWTISNYKTAWIFLMEAIKFASKDCCPPHRHRHRCHRH